MKSFSSLGGHDRSKQRLSTDALATTRGSSTKKIGCLKQVQAHLSPVFIDRKRQRVQAMRCLQISKELIGGVALFQRFRVDRANTDRLWVRFTNHQARCMH